MFVREGDGWGEVGRVMSGGVVVGGRMMSGRESWVRESGERKGVKEVVV